EVFPAEALNANAARRWNRTSSRVQFHTSVCLVQVSVSLYLCVPSAQQGVWPRPGLCISAFPRLSRGSGLVQVSVSLRSLGSAGGLASSRSLYLCGPSAQQGVCPCPGLCISAFPRLSRGSGLVQVSVSLRSLGSAGGLASSRSLYLCVPSAQQGVWPRPGLCISAFPRLSRGSGLVQVSVSLRSLGSAGGLASSRSLYLCIPAAQQSIWPRPGLCISAFPRLSRGSGLVQVSVSLRSLGSAGGLASSRSLYLCVPSAQQGVWPRPGLCISAFPRLRRGSASSRSLYLCVPSAQQGVWPRPGLCISAFPRLSRASASSRSLYLCVPAAQQGVWPRPGLCISAFPLLSRGLASSRSLYLCIPAAQQSIWPRPGLCISAFPRLSRGSGLVQVSVSLRSLGSAGGLSSSRSLYLCVPSAQQGVYLVQVSVSLRSLGPAGGLASSRSLYLCVPSAQQGVWPRPGLCISAFPRLSRGSGLVQVSVSLRSLGSAGGLASSRSLYLCVPLAQQGVWPRVTT
ncbi:hypothetical protein KUCAC02_025082, partial [Chaenocephalus aceratus]